MSVLGLRGAGGRGRHAARRAAALATLPALVLHTTRLQARGVLIWGAALGLYSAALAASYTTFSGSAEQMNQLLEAYPQGMLEAFGITDLADVENYMNSQVFLLAPLALAFFPILAAAGTVAGAEERGTIDVLLGNPIPRWQLVVGSFASIALSLLGILALMGALTQITAALMDVDLVPKSTAAAVLNMWPLCLLFGAVAILCSAVFHRRALAIAIPAFLLFVMYLLNTLGRISEDLEDLPTSLRLLLPRLRHRRRHRLDELRGPHARRPRPRPPRGPRLPPQGHIHVVVSPSLRTSRHASSPLLAVGLHPRRPCRAYQGASPLDRILGRPARCTR